MKIRSIREINAVAIPHLACRAVSSSRQMRFKQMAWTTPLPPSSSARHQARRNASGTIWTPKDEAIRTSAEEALAAMIANALCEGAGEAGAA